MAQSVLHSCGEIEAVYLPGKRDFLLVTFAPRDFSQKTEPFWGFNFAKKAGFAALGFVAKRNNWYPQHAMRQASYAVADVLAEYKCRLTYGSSMGAYGAVKYSKLLSADACAGFGAQFSISPHDEVTNFAYTQYFDEELHAGMSIKAGDVCQNAFLFYDPLVAFDAEHVRAIMREAPHVRLVRIPHTGHDCIKVIAGVEPASRILKACANGDLSEVARLVRHLRSKSPARYAGLAVALVARRPLVASNIVEKYLRSFDKKQAASFYDTVAVACMNRSDLRKAEEYSLRSIELMPQHTPFLRRLGTIYERAEQYENAILWYRRYLHLAPRDAALHTAVARSLLALGRVEEAEISINEALTITQTNIHALRTLAAIKLAQHKATEAIRILQDALQVEPANMNVHLDLSRAYGMLNDHASALKSARAALQISPRHGLPIARVAEIEGRGQTS